MNLIKRYTHAAKTHKDAARMLAAAKRNGDKAGVNQAEQAVKEGGEAVDRLNLFRKNLKSFMRLYEFLSQIVPYDDTELEQLNVYARHLHPLLQSSALDREELVLSGLHLTHYRLAKHAEQGLKLADGDGGYGLEPANALRSGKPHDPEKKRLSEIINALNDLFGAQVSDDDQLHYAHGIADRVERDADVMEQIRLHSEDQVMHGAFPKKVEDTVLDSMRDNESMSLEALGSDVKMHNFARSVLRLLAERL